MADSAIITRRSALVGALSSLFIPPSAVALIQPALAGQKPMTAKERADFHLSEFAKAMDEVTPPEAHSWGMSAGGANGEFWERRYLSYRVPDPEIQTRHRRDVPIDRLVEIS